MGQYGLKDFKSRRTTKLHDWFKSYNNFTTYFQKIQNKKIEQSSERVFFYILLQIHSLKLKYERAAQYSSLLPLDKYLHMAMFEVFYTVNQ